MNSTVVQKQRRGFKAVGKLADKTVN